MQLDAKVNKRAALAYLGYRGQSMAPELLNRLDEIALLCEQELKPSGVYSVLDAAGGNISTLDLPGKDIVFHLKNCEQAAVMAVTLGAQSEMLIRRISAESAVEGLIADACCSSMTEEAARGLNKEIASIAHSAAFSTTKRYSPGYGDLSLDCQSKILSASGADRLLGIHVNESNMLIPSKSITAIIGFYKINAMGDLIVANTR